MNKIGNTPCTGSVVADLTIPRDKFFDQEYFHNRWTAKRETLHLMSKEERAFTLLLYHEWATQISKHMAWKRLAIVVGICIVMCITTIIIKEVIL